MRTFWKLTAISMQSQLYYRTSFFLNLLSPVILLFGQYLLWAALYAQQGGAAIGGMERQEMFAYILLAFAMSNLLNWAGEPIVKRDQDRAGGGQVCPAGGFSDAVSGGDGRRAAHTGCGQSVCGSGWISVFWQIYDNTVSFCTAGL